MSRIPDTYDALFQLYGGRYSVDWLLLKAQAYQESLLNPLAVSPVGAKGLAQFMPKTWAEWSQKVLGKIGNPFLPEHAIPVQAGYMQWLIQRFNWKVAPHDLIPCVLAAYNWGVGNVGKRLRWLPEDKSHTLDLHLLPKETQTYIERITRYYGELKNENANSAGDT